MSPSVHPIVVDVVPDAAPLALARAHRQLQPGTPVSITFIPRGVPWEHARVADLVAGGGFEDASTTACDGAAQAVARRGRTLPDTVGPGMRVLACGLNPSIVAADAGIGYAGATNRFWRAAVEAGLVTLPRDPDGALEADGVGMTDLVKRATPAAAALDRAELVAGAARVRRLAAWLRPAVVLFVGLSGWRAAVDRTAVPGLQPATFGGAPAYVMPSTSGRNAATRFDELVGHMRAALAAGSTAIER